MHPESYNEMARLIATYLSPKEKLRILDVGSFDVNGSYRDLMDNENWKYEGGDMAAGPNVEHVFTDPYHWGLDDEIFDVVMSGQTFEHIPYFWLAWREIVRVLKPGGLIFLIAPSCGPEHRYPVDCWRFYRDGFRALGDLENLVVLEAETKWENPWGDTIGVYWKPLSIQSP
jgi:SAM-dependent methyltransferase